jgi:hypothetical protein
MLQACCTLWKGALERLAGNHEAVNAICILSANVVADSSPDEDVITHNRSALHALQISFLQYQRRPDSFAPDRCDVHMIGTEGSCCATTASLRDFS